MTQQPVRVPNVSPGARSGLDHEVIGSNALEAHAENERLARSGLGLPEVPEDLTTVDALLEWVTDAEDDDTAEARAYAVLTAERERPEDDQRKTLVEPLESLLSDAEDEDGPETPGDGSEAGSGEQDAQGDGSQVQGAPTDGSQVQGTPTDGISTESAGQEAQTQGDPT